MPAAQTILSQQRPTAKLIIEHGPQAGLEFSLASKAMIIGREDDADIVLSDPECSRHHARIQWLPGQLVIEDLGSANGTYVNSVQITAPQLLHTDDRISIAQVTLMLQVSEVKIDAANETILREQNIIPARAVLNNAIDTSQRLGHENFGFLSESHGFMPTNPPLLSLPPSHAVWDEMVETGGDSRVYWRSYFHPD